MQAFKEALVELLKIFIGSLMVCFLMASFISIIAYLILLEEKIERPSYKNLSAEGLAILGLGLLGVIAVDYMIIKWLIKKSKSRIQ